MKIMPIYANQQTIKYGNYVKNPINKPAHSVNFKGVTENLQKAKLGNYKVIEVISDLLYRSNAPTSCIIKTLAECGMKSITNVESSGTFATEKHISEALRYGVEYLHLPSDAHVGNTRSEFIGKFIELLRNPDKLPGLVHCATGNVQTIAFIIIDSIFVRGKMPPLDLSKDAFRTQSYNLGLDFATEYISYCRKNSKKPFGINLKNCQELINLTRSAFIKDTVLI